jgi:hypothetical protein
MTTHLPELGMQARPISAYSATSWRRNRIEGRTGSFESRPIGSSALIPLLGEALLLGFVESIAGRFFSALRSPHGLVRPGPCHPRTWRLPSDRPRQRGRQLASRAWPRPSRALQSPLPRGRRRLLRARPPRLLRPPRPRAMRPTPPSWRQPYPAPQLASPRAVRPRCRASSPATCLRPCLGLSVR